MVAHISTPESNFPTFESLNGRRVNLLEGLRSGPPNMGISFRPGLLLITVFWFGELLIGITVWAINLCREACHLRPGSTSARRRECTGMRQQESRVIRGVPHLVNRRGYIRDGKCKERVPGIPSLPNDSPVSCIGG